MTENTPITAIRPPAQPAQPRPSRSDIARLVAVRAVQQPTLRQISQIAPSMEESPYQTREGDNLEPPPPPGITAQREFVWHAPEGERTRGMQMLDTFTRMAYEDTVYQAITSPTMEQTQQYEQRMRELMSPEDGMHGALMSHLLGVTYGELSEEAQVAFRDFARQLALHIGYQNLVYNADQAQQVGDVTQGQVNRYRDLNARATRETKNALQNFRWTVPQEIRAEFSHITPDRLVRDYKAYVFQINPLRITTLPGERLSFRDPQDGRALFARASEQLSHISDENGSVGIAHVGSLYHDVRMLARDVANLSEMIQVRRIMQEPIDPGLRDFHQLLAAELQDRRAYAMEIHLSILPHMLGVDTFEQLPVEMRESVWDFSRAIMLFARLPDDTHVTHSRGNTVRFNRAREQFRQAVVAFQERGGVGGIGGVAQHITRAVASRMFFKGQVQEVLDTELFARRHFLREDQGQHGAYGHANFPAITPLHPEVFGIIAPAEAPPQISAREPLAEADVYRIAGQARDLGPHEAQDVRSARRGLSRLIESTQIGTDLHVWTNPVGERQSVADEVQWLNTVLSHDSPAPQWGGLQGQSAMLDRQDRFVVLSREPQFTNTSRLAVLVPVRFSSEATLASLTQHFPGVDFIPLNNPRVTDAVTRFYVESFGFIPREFTEGSAAFASSSAAGVVSGAGDYRVSLEAAIYAGALQGVGRDPLLIRQRFGQAQATIDREAQFVIDQSMHAVAATVQAEVATIGRPQNDQLSTRADADLGAHVRKNIRPTVKRAGRARALTKELQQRERRDLEIRMKRPTHVIAQVARVDDAQFVVVQRTGAGNVYVRRADGSVNQTMRPAMVELAFVERELTASQADRVAQELSTIASPEQARHRLLQIAQARIGTELVSIDEQLSAMQTQRTGAIRLARRLYLQNRRQNLAVAQEAIDRMFSREPGILDERAQRVWAQAEKRLLTSRIVSNMIPRYLRKLPEYVVEVAKDTYTGRVENAVQRVGTGDVVIVASETVPAQLLADISEGRSPQDIEHAFSQVNQAYIRYRDMQIQLTHLLEGNPRIIQDLSAEQIDLLKRLGDLNLRLALTIPDARRLLQLPNIGIAEKALHLIEMGIQQMVEFPTRLAANPIRTIRGTSGPMNPQNIVRLSAEIVEVERELTRVTENREGIESQTARELPSVMQQLQELGQIHLPRPVSVVAFAVA